MYQLTELQGWLCAQEPIQNKLYGLSVYLLLLYVSFRFVLLFVFCLTDFLFVLISFSFFLRERT